MAHQYPEIHDAIVTPQIILIRDKRRRDHDMDDDNDSAVLIGSDYEC